MASFADLPGEVKTDVFGYLADDRKSLRSFIRVDGTWHQHTIGLLWQYASAKDLGSITPAARRQQYATMFHKLTVAAAPQTKALRPVIFSALTQLSLGDGCLDIDIFTLVRLWPCLPRTLLRLEIRRYFNFTEDTFDLISLRCPSLQSFIISQLPLGVDSHDLLNGLVFNFAKLRYLEMGQSYSRLSRAALESFDQTLSILETLIIHGHHNLGQRRKAIHKSTVGESRLQPPSTRTVSHTPWETRLHANSEQ